MLVYISFIRKKITKIYLLIYTLLLIALFVLLFASKNFEILENNTYDGSFIEVKSDNIAELKKIKNIKDYFLALKLKDGFEEIYLIGNNELTENEIILPNHFQNSLSKEETIELELNKTYEFNIKNFDSNKNNFSFVNVASQVIEDNKSFSNSYIIILNNWLKKDKTIKKLEDKYGIDNVVFHSHSSSENYETYINIVKVLILVLLFIFIIILLTTCFNIIQDEHKKNDLYYKLGYSKKKILKFNLIKIIILVILSFVIALIFSSIIIYILKMLNLFAWNVKEIM